MTTDDILASLLDEVKGLRDDLKRREARRLEETRGIPNRSPSSSPAPSNGGAVFPNYGRAKGRSIAGATMGDLEYYANGARKSIADPQKARWRSKEETLLAEIEREIARQQGGGQGPSSFGDPPPDSFGAPPPTEDDIPFLKST